MVRRRRVLIAVLAAIALVAAVVVVLVVPRLAQAPAQAPEGEPAKEVPTVEDPAAEEPPAEESQEPERPTVVEESATPVTMAEAPVRTETTDDGLTVTAPEAFLATDEMADVRDAIHQLEQERGATVSVVLLDIQTRRGITYNADASMYPASSIKAAYCAYLFETHGGAGGASALAENCIVNSSNDAYNSLATTFGFRPWAAWLTSHGAAGAAAEASVYTYPRISAQELAAVWEEIWRYGTSGEAGADELTGYLARTTVSPIADELRDDHVVWSKAGWFPADANNIPASNDAGVVFSDEGPYVMVIMTDIGSDLGALHPLIDALDAAHACMCGDAVAYYEHD